LEGLELLKQIEWVARRGLQHDPVGVQPHSDIAVLFGDKVEAIAPEVNEKFM
jgi:hypothetical protein